MPEFQVQVIISRPSGFVTLVECFPSQISSWLSPLCIVMSQWYGQIPFGRILSTSLGIVSLIVRSEIIV